MTHRVDLGEVPRAADEGVVIGNTAVVPQPEHLGFVAGGVLGTLPRPAGVESPPPLS